ncbi:MAG TPA: hypothetical protein VLQ93_01105, partial [Myxococcaceae bacterium]|nr:hypothetical protein [Myxococcaceae bacterium]
RQMKNKLNGVVGAALAVSAMALIPLAASARTTPASSGRAQYWSDGSCFSLSYSTMTNNCSTTKSFEIPLSVGPSGSKTVYVTGHGANSSSSVGCMAIGMNREFTLVYGGTRKWLDQFGVADIITLTDAYVPGWGYLYVNCSVMPGGRVHTVGYND